MEKLTWVKPEMEEVRFAANEYIASCGTNREYIFNCNADEGQLYYYQNERVDANAERPTSFTGPAEELGYFKPNPNVVHTTGDSTDFFWGYVDWNNDGKHTIDGDRDETVIVWLEKFLLWITNFHATTNLNMTSWETTKS